MILGISRNVNDDLPSAILPTYMYFGFQLIKINPRSILGGFTVYLYIAVLSKFISLTMWRLQHLSSKFAAVGRENLAILLEKLHKK